MNSRPPIRVAKLLLLAFALSLCSCTFKYTAQTTQLWLQRSEFIDHHRLYRQQDWTLPGGAAIYVAFPDSRFPDAMDLRVQRELIGQLSAHFPVLESGSGAETPQLALQRARAAGMSFMLYPQLRRLRDEVNSWRELDSGRTAGLGRDRLQVQVQIYDSVNRRLLDTALVSSRSSWLAWQQQAPEHMLGPAFAEFARSLSANQP